MIAGQVVGIYGGYEGDVEVSWSLVNYELTEGQLTLDVYDLAADPDCVEQGVDNATANSCGFHIHVNADCDDAGGHYWDDADQLDPWTDVVYTDSTAFTLNVDYQTNSLGRALVVHDRTGARIACTLLETTTFTSDFLYMVGASNDLGDITYPGYEGDLEVTFDQIDVDLSGTNDVYMYYQNLHGDSLCDGNTFEADNSCGLHLHVGSSCDDADEVGGHFYDSENYADPWLIARYVHGEGYGLIHTAGVEDFQGRVVVIHDSTGARIACTAIPASNIDDSAAILTPLASGFAMIAGYLSQ